MGCKLSSTIVADSVERSCLLTVDGYSSAKERFKTGECLASPLLNFEGHDWVLRYYPNGKSEAGAARHIAIAVECSDPKDGLPVPPISLRHRDGLQLVPPYVVDAFYSIPFISASGLSSYHLFFIDQAMLEQSGDIKDDCFSIRCALTLSERETAGNRFVFVPPSDMHLHFGSLLESMDGADVTFLVGGEQFSAHRLVLAARSSVFRAELLGGMRESAGGPIEIHEMEPDVFRRLIHFIYTDSVPDLQMASNHGEAHLQMASHLLVAADRYNMERLKLICEHKLCSHIDATMVATSLALAEQHCCNGLKEACLQFLASPSNLEAMMKSDDYKHLKSSCPSALKELIASLLPANMKAAKDIVMTL